MSTNLPHEARPHKNMSSSKSVAGLAVKMSELNDGGVMRPWMHAVKAGGDTERWAEIRATTGLWLAEATDMAKEIGHVGATQVERGARDPLISNSPHRRCCHHHPRQCIPSVRSRSAPQDHCGYASVQPNERGKPAVNRR